MVAFPIGFSLWHRNGIYPLTAFGTKQPPLVRSRAISPERAESVKSVTPEPMDVETRKIINMMCDVKPKEDSCEMLVRSFLHLDEDLEFLTSVLVLLQLTIVLRMDDKMNRQLTCSVTSSDSPAVLAQELVHYGFINEVRLED